MKRYFAASHDAFAQRRASTLVIVISMLGLLSLMGTVFYLFAIQERTAAANFSAAAKADGVDLDDPFPWALQQLIIGPDPFQKFSILADATGANRHSLIRNLLGPDVTPFTGLGVRVVYNAAGLPIADANYDLLADGGGLGSVDNLLNFADSVAAWGDTVNETTLADARDYLGADALPHPDVDYTTPDINNLFLAYKGWAIRDNGAGTPRFERVQVIIPSFFRPQYLKSSTANGAGGQDVPTDFDWYDPLAHPEYQRRSLRPHPNHIGGFDAAGTRVFRFFETTRDGASPTSHGPFPFVRGEGGNTANFGKLGVWTGDLTEDPTGFELDSDNDGDGIKEGIWLDLQYPIQETTDGTLYATLHSFTIYDLDGLLDLNAVGNLAQIPRDTADLTTLVGPTGLGSVSVSDSNLGLGPNEINPIWALQPETASTIAPSPYTDWYGASPSNRLEQANMEWIWLLTGRMDYDGALLPASPWTDLFAGRWGDANAVVHHKVSATSSVRSLPRPGRAGDLIATTTNTPSFDGAQGEDDNLDSLEGIASAVTGFIRGFLHPMDFSGSGTNRSADFRLPLIVPEVSGGPAAWLAYAGYSAVGSVATTLNDSAYMTGPDGVYGGIAPVDDLSIDHFFDPLFEDPLEMIMDLDFALRPDDQMFSVQDMLIGHLTAADATGGTVSERLRELMPSTFAESGSDRSDRFTTLSHSFRRVPFLEQPTGPRSWEWTADADGDGAVEFPPQFGAAAPYSALDPFRPEVRRLLTIEAGEQQETIGQLLLSVNHILDVNRSTTAPPDNTSAYLAHMQQFGLQFRALIEHPDNTAAATVTTLPTTQPAFPPQTADQIEYWARRDRQKLARDIYVLLYTLGGAEVVGTAVRDYTGDNSGRVIYSNERLRQMAQFAVNMVDAMDTDNVMTRFEYDKNLGDGWNLDDNPDTEDEAPSASATDTANGLYPRDSSTNRGVVFGVEAQQIAFSEVLAIRSPDFSDASIADDPATPYNDVLGDGDADAVTINDGDHNFLHIELQNILPMPVQLALAEEPNATLDEDRGVWRLARFNRDLANGPQLELPTQTLTLMDQNGAGTVGGGTLSGGDRFTIAMAGVEGTPAATDPTGLGNADFFIDTTADATVNFNLISPDLPVTVVTIASPPTVPETDLDLIDTTHDDRWLMAGNGTDKGRFLDTLVPYNGNSDFGIPVGTAPAPTTGTYGFDLVLQRRQNPNLPLLNIAQNPWIEVDRIRAQFTDLFDIDIAGSTATMHLDKIKSRERREVLDAAPRSSDEAPSVVTYDSTTDASPDANRENTIGSTLNSVTTGRHPITDNRIFELWQAHFDRDYASSGELLNLPIVGPKLLTRSIDRMRFPGFQQALLPISTTVAADSPNNIAGAAGMLLQPDAAIAGTAFDNAWYRLMQFVEVPSRVNRMLGNYINLQRVPGKLNLNTIRHREVYAGLIDDPLIADVPVLLDSPINGDLDGPFFVSTAFDGADATPGLGNRDRWLEFINERDGYVNTLNGTTSAPVQMWLPGTPNSHPFRSLAYTTGVAGATGSPSDTGLDHTILRRGSLHRPTNIADNGALPIDNTFGESSDDAATNRHWLEPGETTFHQNPDSVAGGGTANMVHRHQFLSKIMNNTTTTSNCFIVYGTAAYFEAVLDNGVFRVGGRMGLDLDGDLNEVNDAGWEQRAVFVIDRTEAFDAFDSASGEFEWERLVKHRLDLESDGQ